MSPRDLHTHTHGAACTRENHNIVNTSERNNKIYKTIQSFSTLHQYVRVHSNGNHIGLKEQQRQQNYSINEIRQRRRRIKKKIRSAHYIWLFHVIFTIYTKLIGLKVSSIVAVVVVFFFILSRTLADDGERDGAQDNETKFQKPMILE